MNPKMLRVTPKFYTKDLATTKKFYVNVLGFKCISWEPSWGWSLFGRDHIQLMYTLPHEHLEFEKPCFTGSIYIYVDMNIESLWKELRGQTTVVYPLEDFDYGMKEFAIYDNNGYMLQFGQVSSE